MDHTEMNRSASIVKVSFLTLNTQHAEIKAHMLLEYMMQGTIYPNKTENI